MGLAVAGFSVPVFVVGYLLVYVFAIKLDWLPVQILEIHTRLSKAERRRQVLEIMAAVQLLDVETLIDAYPHQLSGGQRQRRI